MKRIYEVGRGAYDMYGAIAYCETREQAEELVRTLRADAHPDGPPRVAGEVVLIEAGDALPSPEDLDEWGYLREGWRPDVAEPDPFAPGTRVEVHEVPGGYVVFPAEDQP